MPIVAFYSKHSDLELQNEWEDRLRVHYPFVNLVPLLSDQAENAKTALLWKAPLERVKNLNNLKFEFLEQLMVKENSFSTSH